MKLSILFLVILIPIDSFGSVLATDDFNRADSTGLGLNWTKPVAATNQFNVSGNKAIPANFSSGDSYDAYSAITWPNDQYSKVKVTVSGTSGSEQGMGPSVRMDLVLKTVYTAVADHAASNNVALDKIVNNTGTNLGLVTQAFTDGDYFQIQSVGTTISVIYGGSTIISVSDAAIGSGYAGMRYSTAETSASGDDWEGGDLAAAAVPFLPRQVIISQ